MELVLGDLATACFSPNAAIIAGWTGRDEAAINSHIDELAAIGVARPSAVPLFYRVSSTLFTTAPAIEVVGGQSSGEAEPVLINMSGTVWLGVGSDHTDRALETHSVALSKQICPKPVGSAFWLFSDVAGHLDQLELSAWTREHAEEPWGPYQEGTLANIRPLDELAAAAPLAQDGRLAPGTVMMCGTVPVHDGEIRPSRFFRMQLSDPVLGRRIAHEYETICLPLVA
jgi:hypothetical protein